MALLEKRLTAIYFFRPNSKEKKLSYYDDKKVVEEVLSNSEIGPTGWVRENCPFCVSRTGKEDRRKSFSVKEESGYYHCFRCGIKGRTKSDDTFRYIPKLSKADTSIPEIALPDEYTPLWREPGLNANVFGDARAYLRGRNFGRDRWEEARIGACYKGYFSDRIIVPILESGRCLGFVARDWTNTSERKYLYPMGMNKTDLMWNRELLYEITDKFLLIVEGVFDALPYYGRAISLLGKPTKNQVKQLKQATRPVVIALDGDAWEEGYGLSQKLKLSGKQAGFVKLPPGEDPGSVDKEWLLYEAARSMGDL